MVVAKAEDPEKIRAGNHHATAWLRDAHQFSDERLRFLDMFEHVQRADAGEVLIGKRQPSAVIELAALAEAPRAHNVRFGNIHAPRFETRFGEQVNDLSGAAADIQGARTGPRGTECVGVFGVKIRVPVGEKLRVGFVVAVGILMAHFNFHLSEFCAEPGIKNIYGQVAGLALRRVEKIKKPHKRRPAPMAVNVT